MDINKQIEINKLKDDISDKEKEINKLDKENKEQNETIVNLNTHIKHLMDINKQIEINKLKDDISDKEKEINKLDKENKEQNETIVNLNTHIKHLMDINKQIELENKKNTTNETKANSFRPREETKSIRCKFFDRGACRNGKNCRFLHTKTNRKETCWYFETKGWCKFNDKCKYEHRRNKKKELEKNNKMEGTNHDEYKDKVEKLEELIKVIGMKVDKINPSKINDMNSSFLGRTTNQLGRREEGQQYTNHSTTIPYLSVNKNQVYQPVTQQQVFGQGNGVEMWNNIQKPTWQQGQFIC